MTKPDTPVAGDRARWLARIRSILIVRFRLAHDDGMFLDGIEGRLIVRGCHAVISEAERLRVQRIEREMTHAE